MEYLTPLAIGWVVAFFLLGYFRGLWKATAGILGFVGAFSVAALFSAPLSKVLLQNLSSVDIGESSASVVVGVLLFVGTGIIIRMGILFISRRVPIRSHALNVWGGALVSGFYGAGMSVVLVWGASFVIESLKLRQGRDQSELNQAANPTPILVIFSRSIVSSVLDWYLQRLGASKSTAHFAAVYAEQPQQVLQAIQQSVRSEEFKNVVNNPQVQGLMREGNPQALQKSPEFTQLMQQPGVKKLRNLFGGDQAEWSDQHVAEQMVEVWAGVERVKERPEVNRLLNDPEVQTFMREGGSITPSLLAKGQEILGLIRNDEATPNTGTQGDKLLPNNSSESRSLSSPEVYQWRDDAGQLHITDQTHVPPEKLNQAKKVSL